MFSKLRMFSDQSCINRTEAVRGALRFLFFMCFYSHLSDLLWISWKSSLWIGIFQRATQRPRILLADNIESGGSCSVIYYWYKYTGTDSCFTLGLYPVQQSVFTECLEDLIAAKCISIAHSQPWVTVSVQAEGKKRLVLDPRHVNPHLFKYKLLEQCPDYAHARGSSFFFSFFFSKKRQ